MAVCPSCGHQNAEIAKFCEHCGTALSQGAGEQESWDLGKTIQSPRSVRSSLGEGRPADAAETRPIPQLGPARDQERPASGSSQPTVVTPVAQLGQAAAPKAKPAKRRSKLPIVLVGVAALLVLCCGGFGVAFVFGDFSIGGVDFGSLTNSGNKWATSSTTTVSDVLDVDLSSLGLQKQVELDARDSFNFESASMTSGRMDIYSKDNDQDNPAAAVTALYYEDKSIAGTDFQTFLDRPDQVGVSTKAINTINHTGSGKFEFSESFERLQWSDNWIIHVIVIKSQVKDTAAMRDRIWDKFQEHLKTIK